jgi:hypothetical protein
MKMSQKALDRFVLTTSCVFPQALPLWVVAERLSAMGAGSTGHILEVGRFHARDEESEKEGRCQEEGPG